MPGARGAARSAAPPAHSGASCAWTCGRGVSDFRRFGATERAVWPVACVGTVAARAGFWAPSSL
eukprot:1716103-Alexandrium_andersonii.AAC.1